MTMQAFGNIKVSLQGYMQFTTCRLPADNTLHASSPRSPAMHASLMARDSARGSSVHTSTQR